MSITFSKLNWSYSSIIRIMNKNPNYNDDDLGIETLVER